MLAVAVSDIGALHRKDRSLSACPGLPHSPPSRSAVQFERVCPQCGRESVAPWRRGRFMTLQHSGEFLDLVAEEEAADERQREREREESRKRDHPPGPFSTPTKLLFFSSPPCKKIIPRCRLSEDSLPVKSPSATARPGARVIDLARSAGRGVAHAIFGFRRGSWQIQNTQVCVGCLFLRSPSQVPYRTELILRAPKGRRTRTPHP